jgi:hypothetical protein
MKRLPLILGIAAVLALVGFHFYISKHQPSIIFTDNNTNSTIEVPIDKVPSKDTYHDIIPGQEHRVPVMLKYDKTDNITLAKVMQVLISTIAIAAAFVVVLARKHPYPSVQKHWAFGIIGTVIGFWFKS